LSEIELFLVLISALFFVVAISDKLALYQQHQALAVQDTFISVAADVPSRHCGYLQYGSRVSCHHLQHWFAAVMFVC